ncbi:hypothetical protein AB0M95_28625 [Sphaerisporangium sp. NPDC051017]|uniref:DUF6082 family protein n=1 Tax=Sphaerisporangium sp. NPDC051017 TaxID=3154636 RepID=UPI003434BA07
MVVLTAVGWSSRRWRWKKPEWYMPVLGISGDADPMAARRQFFAMTVMNYHRMGYGSGVISESSMREEGFAAMFSDRMMRDR